VRKVEIVVEREGSIPEYALRTREREKPAR
jgi:hypothetical protein